VLIYQPYSNSDEGKDSINLLDLLRRILTFIFSKMVFPQKDIGESKSVYLTSTPKYPMIEIEIICITLLAFTSKNKSIVLSRELSKAFKIKPMSDLGV
jgi:hypothetical protein